jgi:amino acid transporter
MGLLFIYVLIKITDQSLVSTIREIVRELPSLGRMTPKGINVLGGVLIFAIIIFLYFSGLTHIVLPDAKHAANTGDISRIISLGVVVCLAAYFIICIQVTKNAR